MCLCKSVLDNDRSSKEDLESCEAAVLESIEGSQHVTESVAGEDVMWNSYRQRVIETFRDMSLNSPSNSSIVNAGDYTDSDNIDKV